MFLLVQSFLVNSRFQLTEVQGRGTAMPIGVNLTLAWRL